DTLEPAFRIKNRFVDGTWADEKGEAYSGKIPYIVIALDGTKNDNLEKFIPTALSASVMSQFFDAQVGKATAASLLKEAIKVYSDSPSRQRADANDKEIGTLTPQAENYAKEKASLEKEREALIKNILAPELKPKS